MTQHILYISGNGFPSDDSDARGVFSLEHAQALQQQGVEVTAVDTQASGFGCDAIGSLSIHRIPRLRALLRRKAWSELKRYVQTFAELRKGDYDTLIFSFAYEKYLPMVLFLKKKSTKMLVITHGGDVMPCAPHKRFAKRFLLAMADVVTPVSDFTAALTHCLLGRCAQSKTRIITIYNGVNHRKLVAAYGRDAMREQLGIKADDFVLLSIGNLVKRKGIDVVMRAAISQMQQGAALSHVIIGRGVQADALKQLAAESGFGDRFHFIESAENLADYYAMADLFALVSTTDWRTQQTEGFGIVYAEAMAMGLPVIGGGSSGTTSVVQHGFTGFLVDGTGSGDAQEQVEAAIMRFREDKDFYAACAQNARHYARDQFDWNKNATQTLRALESLR